MVTDIEKAFGKIFVVEVLEHVGLKTLDLSVRAMY